MTRFEELQRECNERYNNSMYTGDADFQNVLALLKKAETLSDAAKAEFASQFSLNFAFDGLIYLGSKNSAPRRFPHLWAEAAAAGITIETR